jgi:hypothetical protein
MSMADSRERPRPGARRLPGWLWPILLSALAWLVIFLAIPPARQNFPLDDDWAFAHGAIWFAHGLGIHYSRWASMPQLGQWLWSFPFLYLTELAHVALRISVIVLSWLGLVAFYDLLRREKIPAGAATYAVCVLALNPLFFISQGTYMTDVPALSLGLLALSFYVRALDEKNGRWLLLASLLAVLAAMTRQTMLVVPAAAGILLLRRPELRWKPGWLVAVSLPAGVGLYTCWWFTQRSDVAPMQAVFSFRELPLRSFVSLQLCGLVVLPLCLRVPWQKNWRLPAGCLVVMLLAATLFYHLYQGLAYERLYPYCYGMVSPYGTFAGDVVAGGREILLTRLWRTLLTILGCVGAAQILAALVQLIRAGKFPGGLLWFTLLQFFIVFTLPAVADRYFEVLFPGAIFLVVTRCFPPAPGRTGGVALAVGLYALISIALMHDWLAWNAARWELGRQLIATRVVQPEDIEGGFEWNGWFTCPGPGRPQVLAAPGRPNRDDGALLLPFTRHYFPDVIGEFALAFTPLPNSMVVASQPYSRWLPPATKTFFLVQQTPQR